MIALYLLAAHLVGDFVLQTRWQAGGKFGDTVAAFEFRTRHVLAYCLPFVPIAVVYSHGAWDAAAFMALLFVLHFFTDRQRFNSTLGDIFACIFAPKIVKGLPPPNPWKPTPVMIDQALHVCQVALLGGLFLS